jgi:hypothetical protein
VRRPHVALALLLPAMLALASCGGAASPRPVASTSSSSGVYGIAVTTPAGMIPAGQPASSLPGGFGLSDMVPAGDTTIIVKATSGSSRGNVVARVVADSQGLFRVSLPPGSYFVYGPNYRSAGSRVVVSEGSYTRTIVDAVLHW